jgi:predicted nucleic acid-binding protein
MLVLDASAVIAWAYDDETGLPDSVMDRVGSDSVSVPTHWILEVTNTLVVGERRGRLKAGQRQEILARIQILPIRVDTETSFHGWKRIPELAMRYGLTTYDAAYLELALRMDAPLATLDKDLARAARGAGVPLFK